MSTKRPLAYFLGENPLRAVEWPLWSILFLSGLYLVSPFWMVEEAEGTNGAIITAIASREAFLIYGGLVCSTGALGLAGLIWGWARLRKWAAHILFFVFLYFTILRIGFTGLENLGWVTYALNVFLSAAIILRIRWEELADDGTPN